MKIVFLDEYSVSGADTSAIREMGDYTAYYETTSKADTIARCQGADVVISNKVVIDREVIEACDALKLVCVAATGMNNVDLEAAAEHGIDVRNAVGYSTHSVAEATISSALTLLRQSLYFDRFVKSGSYSASPRLFNFDRPIRQLNGRRWGIIGMGNIGRKVAALASAFGCPVRYCSTSGAQRKEDYPSSSLNELLSWADIISIHSPLNAQTSGLIGAEELEKMRDGALLINVARGGIVDEQALAAALDSGKLAGAATDVFAQEPLEGSSPLLKIKCPDQLLLSPHSAWAAKEAIDQLILAIAKNITDHFV
ncbi:MAG: NAD(P)-dependent oxidoreductase [Rikenellaceae bacterium]